MCISDGACRVAGIGNWLIVDCTVAAFDYEFVIVWLPGHNSAYWVG